MGLFINNLDKSEVPKPPVWLGVRSAHTLWYVSDEQRRQARWIGCRTGQVIYERALYCGRLICKLFCMGLLCCLSLTASYAADGFTQKDRELLIELKVKIGEIDKRFEQIDKRFEQVDRRFEQVDRRFEQVDRRFEVMGVQTDAQFTRMTQMFVALFLGTIGFALWDRRTMIRPFETKIKAIDKEIGKIQGQQEGVIEAFRLLGGRDAQVAEVLKRFNLL